jgi:hypothetical protein
MNAKEIDDKAKNVLSATSALNDIGCLRKNWSQHHVCITRGSGPIYRVSPDSLVATLILNLIEEDARQRLKAAEKALEDAMRNAL